MNEIKVTIEGEDFYIDIEQAQKLGLLKDKPSIKDFKVGDLFKTEGGGYIIIVPCGYNNLSNERYSLGGLHGFDIFSNFGKEGVTKKQILAYLNQSSVNAKYVKNVNKDVEALMVKLISK